MQSNELCNEPQMKRERFIEELETYTKQVDEFAMLSDMNDVAKYLKKAQSLNTKLETAAERVLAFNAEEEAFGWPITQYPLRVSALATLKPYLQLYELTVDFNSKQKCARLLQLAALSGHLYTVQCRCWCWCTALHCTALQCSQGVDGGADGECGARRGGPGGGQLLALAVQTRARLRERGHRSENRAEGTLCSVLYIPVQ